MNQYIYKQDLTEARELLEKKIQWEAKMEEKRRLEAQKKMNEAKQTAPKSKEEKIKEKEEKEKEKIENSVVWDSLRLHPKLVQEIICFELERAAIEPARVETTVDGYLEPKTLRQSIFNYIEQYIDPIYGQFFSMEDKTYKISEIVKGINRHLNNIGKEIIIKQKGRRFLFKGWESLHDDWIKGYLAGNKTSIDSGVFEFIKSPLNFEMLCRIRNIISIKRKAVMNELQTYNDQSVQFKRKKLVTKQEKENFIAERMATKPFISIEDSVYEFTPEYADRSNKRTDILSAIANAIITHRVLKISYQAHHYDLPDDLEFHAHYIRKVGNKTLIYGISRSIKWHAPDHYETVNLVLERIVNVTTEGVEMIQYQSPTNNRLGYEIDYEELFSSRIAFNAHNYRTDEETQTILLKVVKEVKTRNNARMPFKRICQEPLHHTQKVVREDDTHGYVSIDVKDFYFAKPLLLPWGGDVEVVEPEALRGIMTYEIRKMALAYGLIQQPDEESKEG